MSTYYRLTFELPAAEQEVFSIELFARGALGLESETVGGAERLNAYFSYPLPAEIGAAKASWERRGIHWLSNQLCHEQDWQARHRLLTRPIEVGRRFVLDPREPGCDPPVGDRILLRVPARRAFGTGSHESTRLVLEWLEEIDLRGLRVLDLGSGTGVLSLAAMHLGAVAAFGLDIDPVATFVAVETRRLNAGEFHLVAGDLACLGAVRFDLALVNILPHEWIEQAPQLAARMRRAGMGILSGMTTAETEVVGHRLGEAGLEVVDQRRDGEWAALSVRRAA